jgi:TetR/AcrR family transcriptional regulator
MTAGRQERRKARTRGQILDAAEELFCAAGDATVEQIAEAADVAVATVYAHFSGKQDLYRAVAERAVGENERHMLAVYGSDAAPVDKLIDAAAAYLRFYRESPQLFRLVALRQEGPGAESGGADAMMARRVDRMTQALAGVIAQGVADGSLRSVAPLDTARFLWGAMNGLVGLALRPDPLRLSERQLSSAVAEGLEIILEGLIADAQRGPDGRLPARLRTRARTAARGGPGRKDSPS